ncbi:MAG: Fe-S center protein [Legionellales bacterium RIFCSPHIGHO2_12_FULL_35_11]|nr:MAG: Fe-S center protein [Legionellales bacterium RIFCSPHIGHO2_12_FULL_35_11]
MNALEKSLENAIENNGESTAANKAYLEFIKANFIIPVEKDSKSGEPEVLYLNDNNHTFLPVFSSQNFLDKWAREISDKIKILQLSGVDLLKGIGENIIVCLNPGSQLYKEFNPAELARMRSMVLKIFKN